MALTLTCVHYSHLMAYCVYAQGRYYAITGFC